MTVEEIDEYMKGMDINDSSYKRMNEMKKEVSI